MSQDKDLNFVTKALPTMVNEHVFAKARELGLNEAVGCLDFAINFPTNVDEVMKRRTKLPFMFYTHPRYDGSKLDPGISLIFTVGLKVKLFSFPD